MSTEKASAIVELFPSKGAWIGNWPRVEILRAWERFQRTDILLKFVDATLPRHSGRRVKNMTEIIWNTDHGYLCLVLYREKISSLQAWFDPTNPCRYLSLFVACIAELYDLSALTDRGLIPAQDIIRFSRAVSRLVESTRAH